MKIHNVLSKVYSLSAVVVISTIILACFVYQWPLQMTIAAILACIVISSPPAISLHLLFLLAQKIRIEKNFVWMVLLASVPVSSFIAAWLSADFFPGKLSFLLLLGMLSGYAGILMNSISVSQFFNSTKHERE
jgi:hypothetical protein